jgi:hypothetical protein
MSSQLLEWYNLIFELPLGLALMYLALYTFSGWSFGEADADAGGFDHDVDAHLDVNGDVNLDHDADLSHDVQADADTDADTDGDAHDSQPSGALWALSWVGVGLIPLSLILLILMLSWGAIGFTALQIQHDRPINQSIAISIAAAGAGSLVITHLLASILGRTLFAPQSAARRRHEILGSLGEAMYPIDEKFGMVCGRDDSGELFQVPCRVEQGQKPIAEGEPVQLVAYTAKDEMFFVVPAASSITPRRTANSNV